MQNRRELISSSPAALRHLHDDLAVVLRPGRFAKMKKVSALIGPSMTAALSGLWMGQLDGWAPMAMTVRHQGTVFAITDSVARQGRPGA